VISRCTLPSSSTGSRSWRDHAAVLLVAACLASTTLSSRAQAVDARQAPAADARPWASLTPAQRNALRPLEGEWGKIDGPRRAKWLEIADRFPSMAPAEQSRIQNRMEDWARMTPRERGQARLNFREAQQVPAQERKAKWEAYNALPPEERKQLAAQAAPPARKPATDPQNTAAKSNVVPNPAYAPKPKPIAPTVAQAQPGATTNLITKRPNPPPHQAAGMPKIAAAPGFVDQSTLLPKRGPQGAATRSASVASTPSTPRQ
jgi:hypothetical protein